MSKSERQSGVNKFNSRGQSFDKMRKIKKNFSVRLTGNENGLRQYDDDDDYTFVWDRFEYRK